MIVGESMGIVIFKNDFQALAASMRAASNSSSGTPCSLARRFKAESFPYSGQGQSDQGPGCILKPTDGGQSYESQKIIHDVCRRGRHLEGS